MNRAPQTYENHRRVYPLHHLILSPLTLIALITASVALVQAWLRGMPLITPVLTWLLTFMVALVGVIARRNALVVQDRVIRTEENLRHFMLTGKPLESRLSLPQVIALRFAADEEFVQLAARAAESGMKPDDIKRAVRQWRPDRHRV